MKIATLISAIITSLLMLSTMICGLWIRANNVIDPSSFDFHITCGVASVILCFVTLALIIIQARTKKR